MDTGSLRPLAGLPEPGSSVHGSLEGEAGPLECLLTRPREAPVGIALTCHPHPLYGGAMSNKVVYTLDSIARQRRFVTLRFNFRGVGASSGTYDHARGEMRDCIRLAQWLRAQCEGLPLLLAGFSFGGFVSLGACAELQPAVLLTVAPPLSGYLEGVDDPQDPACPWLLLHSRDDEVVPFSSTERALPAYPSAQLAVVDGAGHFFHGQLGLIRDTAVPFLDRHWPRG